MRLEEISKAFGVPFHLWSKDYNRYFATFNNRQIKVQFQSEAFEGVVTITFESKDYVYGGWFNCNKKYVSRDLWIEIYDNVGEDDSIDDKEARVIFNLGLTFEEIEQSFGYVVTSHQKIEWKRNEV